MKFNRGYRDPVYVDEHYKFKKDLVDSLKVPIGEAVYKKDIKKIHDRTGVTYHMHRRGLVNHPNYLDALMWTQKFANGPISLFIRGYKWPFHTRKDYRGLMFMTNGAVKKED